MSTSSISSLASLTPTIPAPSSSSLTSSATSSSLASQDVFLQLLVAQLKNQDPEQPTDGTAFVTELAQFTTLQQDTQSATDLNTIVSALPSLTPAAPTTPATTTNVNNQ
jgi:flagellar basal-body rod modification protein FlgD